VQMARLQDKYEPQETAGPMKVTLKTKDNGIQKSLLPISKRK